MLYTATDGFQKEIEELSLDLNAGVKQRTSDLKYKKGDRNSRTLITQFYDNDMPFNLHGYNVRIYVIKPDDTKVFDDCEIIDYEHGTIKITLKEQMLNVAGTVRCEFVLTTADGSLMSTPIFKITVQDSIHDTQAIESSNEFSALLNAIDTVDGLDNKMQVLKAETEQEIAKTNAQLSATTIELNEIQSNLNDDLKATQSELVDLVSIVNNLRENKLDITEKASDSSLLNGVTDSDKATPNTIVKRNSLGDVAVKRLVLGDNESEISLDASSTQCIPSFKDGITSDIMHLHTTRDLPIEYGKFTPYIYGLTSGKKLLSETSTVFGRYMRVGRMVHVDLRVVWNGKNGVGDSEHVGIAGLPFAPKYAYGSLNIGLYHGIGINLAETSLATYTDAAGIKLFVNTNGNWGALTAVRLATAGSIEMSGHYFIESV